MTCVFPCLVYSIGKNRCLDPSMLVMSRREGRSLLPACKVRCSGRLISQSFCIASVYILVASIYQWVESGSTNDVRLVRMLDRKHVHEGSTYEIEIEMHGWVSTCFCPGYRSMYCRLEKILARKFYLYFHLNEGNVTVASIQRGTVVTKKLSRWPSQMRGHQL
jgi:hypothetical protein